MLWTTHLAIGLLVYAFFIKLGLLPDNQLTLVLVLLGAILPDIDHPRSFIAQLGYWSRTGSRMISWAGHRGVAHTIWAVILVFFIVYLIFPELGLGMNAMLAVTLGYFSHLVADSLTVEGVAWFYPYSSKRASGPVRTGGFLETLIFIASILFIVVLMYPPIIDRTVGR